MAPQIALKIPKDYSRQSEAEFLYRFVDVRVT